MASNFISRSFSALTGGFVSLFWGDTNSSVPLYKMAHDVNQVVDDAHPLPTLDSTTGAAVVTAGTAIVTAVGEVKDKAALSATALGTLTDAAVTNPANPGSVIAILKGLLTKWAGLDVAAAALVTWVDAAGNEMGKAANAVIGGLVYNATTQSPADGASLPLQANSEGRLKVSATRGRPANVTDYACPSGGILVNTPVLIGPAAAAGVVQLCGCLYLANKHASIDTEVELQDGSGGAVLWRGFVKFGTALPPIEFSTPKRSTAGNALYVKSVSAAALVVSADVWTGVAAN